MWMESNNVGFLKTYNTKFDEITIPFVGQNGRLLEIEDKLNLTLLINRDDMLFKLSNILFYRIKDKSICQRM